jgi:UDP:flavonoid glycosyltransferase YjiC (YdhE family)
MRILLSARPAFGHVYPLVPLALAARDAGHDVVFATGESFVPRLRRAGFAVHPAGIAVSEAEAEARRRLGPDADPFAVILTTFAEVLPGHTLDDLAPLLDKVRPDLVVYEQSDAGAAGAAVRAGIPAVSHVIGRSMPAAMLDAAAKRLAWLWDGHRPADPMLGDTCLDIWPPALADPGTAAVPHRIPIRPTPWHEPAPRPPVLGRAGRDRPLVYLTLGTVAYRAVEVLRAAVAGLAALPVDVLVAVGPGDPAALGPVPERVHVARFVPQTEVLAAADLVVHHGGTGTLLGALAAGLPQLLLPQGADQFANADLLAGQGAGRALIGGDSTPDAISAAVDALLTDPSHRHAARAVAAEIAAMPTPGQVVAELATRTA